MLDLKELISAAQTERWDFVDKHIALLADTPEAPVWATSEGLEAADDQVRDLAASILEKSSAPLLEHTKGKLLQVMAADKNIYAQFRSAFALYAHGDRSPEVLTKMEEASQDPATAEIAKKYLEGK